MQELPKTYWEVLNLTAANRQRQARTQNLQPNQPRTDVCEDLKPFINSTTWPHDNSPLPRHLIRAARRHPFPYDHRFDDGKWHFTTPGNNQSWVLLMFLCSWMPVIVIMCWLMSWCPSIPRYEVLPAPPLPPPPPPVVECHRPAGDPNNTWMYFSPVCSETAVPLPPQAPPPVIVTEYCRCGHTARVVVFWILSVILGFPGICCILASISPVIDYFMYYYFPLGQQLRTAYPIYYDSWRPMSPQKAAYLNHMRALTLLYTVQSLSRLPTSGENLSFFQRFLWRCSLIHHYQIFGDGWVLRAEVEPSGAVKVRSVHTGVSFVRKIVFFVRDFLAFFGLHGIVG